MSLDKFISNFKATFFDANRKQQEELALWALCQTGTVLAYTQDFNTHAHLTGYNDDPLISW